MRSTATYCDYNFRDDLNATKNLSNLFIKKNRNLNIISNFFFSILINDVKRRLISNIIVAKANKVSTIREI